MDDYNRADKEPQLPFDVNGNAAPPPPPPLQPNQPQQIEKGLSHDDQFCVGCCPAAGGIWVYVCFRCIGSFGHNHMAPPPLTNRPPHIVHALPCMANCCHSGENSIHTSFSVTGPQKKYSMDDKPTVRVYCKSLTKYSLTICDGQVTLAPTNPDDPHQHWIKDQKFSTQVKDRYGVPSFALINKATGQAMKHSIGVKYPVQLKKYNPDKLDISVLWTLGNYLGDGYRAIRAVGYTHLHVDAAGTDVVLWDWHQGDNQRWTIISY